jgi:arylsulfatase A-like enzyme
VLLISVDTLRADRMSGYGHSRATSPQIDALLARGVRFTQARTPAPLTAPAMASVMTSLHPHEHGSSRNGLRVRPNLVAVTQIMERRGYRSAAFVGNWTLKPEVSGLDEHFETYEALLDRRRWFGLARREATADDLNREAFAWLDDHLESTPSRPFFLWVHYVEPHAPYRLRKEFLSQIGVKARGGFFSARKRYDSEIAFVDDRIGKLLEGMEDRIDLDETVIFFVADHGESLGEHGYWGHGRHLFEVTLHVPMGVVWPSRLAAGTITEPASLLDFGPTLLGLIGLPVPGHFQGHDWSPVLLGKEAKPVGRVTWHQAHKAAVQPKEDIERLRQRGLLAVGRVEEGRKEIFRVPTSRFRVFDLERDPKEKRNEIEPESRPSPELRKWLDAVRQGLASADELPPPSLTEEDIEALRALGYID